MIAALPMYERGETRGAHDRLWAMIRDELLDNGIDAPQALTRAADPWRIWEDPALLIAQTCSLPFRARLHDTVTLIGTPDYGLPDLAPGFYNSVIIMRAGAHPGPKPVPAINDALSQSGWSALYEWSRDVDVTFGDPIHSGAHIESARMVANGTADIAAIDAVTWRFLEAYEPSLVRELTVVGDTPSTPGLPLITARPDLAGALFSAVDHATGALAPADARATGLRALVRIPSSAYLSMPIPPSPAAA